MMIHVHQFARGVPIEEPSAEPSRCPRAWISSRVPQDPSGEDPGEGTSTGAAAIQAEEALPPSANCQQCAHSPFRMFAGDNRGTLSAFRAPRVASRLALCR